jgi:hypothetical protein
LTPDGPVQVTVDCEDHTFRRLIIDTETDETKPSIHRKVSGHFENTTVTVNYYFPPKIQWKRRFFHFVYPVQTADAVEGDLAFSLSSGAYWVQITGGVGYRADAAAAKFSRHVAARYYNDSASRIYGYIFGGSGGSYQTVGAIENSVGVWDGAVAFIQGVPVSNPPNFSVKALAGFVLADKAASITDAVSPGGTGNPFYGLSKFQQSILQESLSVGTPLRSWENFDRVGGTRSLVLLNESYRGFDSRYGEDFFKLPGYAGTEKSLLGNMFREALLNYSTTVTQVSLGSTGSPSSFSLASLPPVSNVAGIDFVVYDAAGKQVGLVWGALNVAAKTVQLYDASDPAAVAALHAGAKIRMDNAFFLAMHTYHRHQIPTSSGFHGFDQFLGVSGKPIYPQRFPVLSELMARGASGGGTQTGMINTKLIAVNNLLDSDAYPGQAVWYRDQVKRALGASFKDNYRLWFNDHANHDYDDPPQGRLRSQLVPFRGIIQYALLELSDWVEGKVLPAKSSGFSLNGMQLTLPSSAKDRYGIQPVAKLTANGAIRTVAKVGEAVKLRAHVASAPGEGEIVALEWDWEGTGDFVPHKLGTPRHVIDVKAQHTYKTLGTFLPAVRVTVQRDGIASSPFARVMNLGRARVVVQ